MAQISEIKVPVLLGWPTPKAWLYALLAALLFYIFSPLLKGTLLEELFEALPTLVFVGVMIWQFRASVPAGEELVITPCKVTIPGSLRRGGQTIEVSKTDIVSVRKSCFRSRGNLHTWTIKFLTAEGRVYSLPMLMIDCDKIAQGVSAVWDIEVL